MQLQKYLFINIFEIKYIVHITLKKSFRRQKFTFAYHDQKNIMYLFLNVQ